MGDKPHALKPTPDSQKTYHKCDEDLARALSEVHPEGDAKMARELMLQDAAAEKKRKRDDEASALHVQNIISQQSKEGFYDILHDEEVARQAELNWRAEDGEVPGDAAEASKYADAQVNCADGKDCCSN